MKMVAAILEKLNAPLILGDVEIPKLSCGQVLVEVHCSGICGAQIGEIRGIKGDDPHLPHLLGHEGGGIVVEVGPGVSHIHVEDHVVMHWRKGIGIESQAPVYRCGDRQIGAGRITTFNEYAVVSENRLTPIPMDIPFEIAALMGCCVTTALGLINNEAHLKIGQSIAVIGCGGVGLSIIQGASMVSGNPIIAIDIRQEKLDLAITFGATHTINAYDNRICEEITKIMNGVDVVVECTGQRIQDAYQMTAPHGRTIMVGHPHCLQNLLIPSIAQHFKGKTLMDSEGGQTNPTLDIPRYLNLYQSKKLKLEHLITDRFQFEDINIALDKVRRGEVIGRCILFHKRMLNE